MATAPQLQYTLAFLISARNAAQKRRDWREVDRLDAAILKRNREYQDTAAIDAAIEQAQGI